MSTSRVQIEDIKLEIDRKVSNIPKVTTLSSSPKHQSDISDNVNTRTSLNILIASWNMGNTMPPSDSKLLNDWIPEGGGDFDVIALGLQESTYKSDKISENLVTDSWSAASEEQDERCSSVPNSVLHDTEVYDVDEEEEEEDLESEVKHELKSKESDDQNGANKSLDVIVKRSRTKKSMRKMTKMVRKLSSNLRDSIGDALDYPFSKQIYLHLGESYVLAGKVELMEMRLFVYVHERNNVCDVEKLAVPTGLGSVIGNKGGLLLKCVVQNTSLCFASCHLAAHQDQKFLDKRNTDCSTILGAQFGQKNVSIDNQFDHCFWFGDLNYRLDLSYSTPRQRTHEIHCAEIMTLIRAKKWTLALFSPTFKRVRHTLDEYLVRL